MADRTVRYVLQADTTTFDQRVKSSAKAVDSLGDSTAKARDANGRFIKSGQQAADAAEQLGKKSQQASKSLHQAISELDKIGASAHKASELLKGPPKQLEALAKASGRSVPQVRAELQKMAKAGQDAGVSIKKTESSFMSFGKSAAGAFAAIGVVSFVKDSVKAASDLSETINKSTVIFGANGKAIEQWAAGASKSLGLSKQAALEAAASLGDMFSQIGFTGAQAATQSTAVVQLAADLGSFNNLDTSDVLDRISASFRGEYDSLQKVIPNISAARVQQEAMAETGKKNAAALTAQEKATATLAIIQKDGARATGDFARTQDGLANKSKIARAEFENMKAAVGEQLLPVISSLLTSFQDLLPVIEMLATAGAQVVKFFAALPAPVQAAVVGLIAMRKITGSDLFGKLTSGGTAFSRTIAGIGKYLGPAGLAISGVAALISAFPGHVSLADKATKDYADDVTALAATFDQLSGAMTKSTKELVAQQLTEDDVLKTARELGLNLADVTDSALGSADATARLRVQIAGAQAGIVSSSDSYKSYKNVLDEAGISAADLGKAVESGNAAFITDKIEAYRKSLGDSADAGVKLTGAQQAVTEILQNGFSSVSGYSDLMDALGITAHKTADAQQDVIDKLIATGTAQVEPRAEFLKTKAALEDAGTAAAKTGPKFTGLGDAQDIAKSSAVQLRHELALLKPPIDPLVKMEEALGKVSKAADDAQTQIAFFGIQVDKLAGRSVSAEEAVQLLHDQTRAVRDAFKEATDATEGNIESLINSSAQYKKTGEIINTTTEAGSNLADSLDGFRDAYDTSTASAYANAKASGNVKGALGEARDAADAAREKFLAQAAALKINKEDAGRLADELGILEGKKLTNKDFDIKADDQATKKITDVQALIDGMRGKEVTLTIKQNNRLQGAADAVRIPSGTPGVSLNAAGGLITGPGGPTSDSILAGLSNGEFVVRASEVPKYLPWLHAMNEGKFPGYAAGGRVDVNMKAPNLSGADATSMYRQIWAAADKAAAASKTEMPAAAAPGTVPSASSAGVQQWRALATSVVLGKGLPLSVVEIMLTQMEHESGGNPAAINLTDINAQQGHPSVGLLQFIPSTFAAYADPGFNSNIYDPESQMRAFLNYVPAAYGSFDYLAGIGFGPYAHGGQVGGRGGPDSMLARVSPGEFVVEKDAAQRNLGWLHAINDGLPGFAAGGPVLPGIGAIGGYSSPSLGQREGAIFQGDQALIQYIRDLGQAAIASAADFVQANADYAAARTERRAADKDANAKLAVSRREVNEAIGDSEKRLADARKSANKTASEAVLAAEKRLDEARKKSGKGAADAVAKAEASLADARRKSGSSSADKIAKAEAAHSKVLRDQGQRLDAATAAQKRATAASVQKEAAARAEAISTRAASIESKKLYDAQRAELGKLTRDRALLATTGRRLDTLTARRESTRGLLDQARADRSSAVDSRASGFAGIGGGALAFTGQRDTASSFIRGLDDRRRKTEAYGKSLTVLRGFGLTKGSLFDEIGSGSDDAIAQAALLARSGRGVVQRANRISLQTDAAARRAAAVLELGRNPVIAHLDRALTRQDGQIATMVRTVREISGEVRDGLRGVLNDVSHAARQRQATAR